MGNGIDMSLGFIPKKNEIYTIKLDNNMVFTEKFHNRDHYLIATNNKCKGNVVHKKVRINKDIELKIKENIDMELMWFRTPTAIVLGKKALLELSAKLCMQNNKDTIELVSTYMQLPVFMSSGISSNVVLITSEPTSSNII